MGFYRIRCFLLLLGFLLLTACGGSNGSDDDGEVSETYGSYISLNSPSSIANDDYTTDQALASPSGYAEVPRSIDCSQANTAYLPSGYRITVINSANNQVANAYASLSCALGIPRILWATTGIALEIGQNKLIARVSYPTEDISGQVSQIVTRVASKSGPVIIQTYPMDLATEVPCTTFISVKFNGELGPDSIDAESIIVKDQNMVVVIGSVGVEFNTEKNYSTLSFNPDYPLAPAALHSVSVTPGIKNIQGVELPDNYNWSFTTSSN